LQRQAFTLVELVLVTVILGILVAVAAPKFLETNNDAADSSLRENLRVLRDAIERYVAANSGVLPGDAGAEADLKQDLAPYLRKFPNNPLKGSDSVYVQTTGTPFTAEQGGGYGWLYDASTGDIRANSGRQDQDGKPFYEF
jgi:prepilin-type N-terminal cleavage/methylation domain-containing protein